MSISLSFYEYQIHFYCIIFKVYISFYFFYCSVYADHQGSRINGPATVFCVSTYDLDFRKSSPLFSMISEHENESHVFLAFKTMDDIMKEQLGQGFNPISIVTGNSTIFVMHKGSVTYYVVHF